MNDIKEARALYTSRFPFPDSKTVLNYAENHGGISLLYKNGVAVNLILTAPLSGGITYIFGAATRAGYERRGYFAENLRRTVGSAPAALIPAGRELFPLYTRLGFAPLTVLKAYPKGASPVLCADIPQSELLLAYERCFRRPKGDAALFGACVRSHLECGGGIARLAEGVYALTENGCITDIFAPSPESAAEAVAPLNAPFALLPCECAPALAARGVKYAETEFAFGKNLPEGCYINTLFN